MDEGPTGEIHHHRGSWGSHLNSLSMVRSEIWRSAPGVAFIASGMLLCGLKPLV